MKRIILVALLGVTLVTTATAIEWRDTDDDVKNDIAGSQGYLTWQFKDIMADRRAAEQLERIADAAERQNQISVQLNTNLLRLIASLRAQQRIYRR